MAELYRLVVVILCLLPPRFNVVVDLGFLRVVEEFAQIAEGLLLQHGVVGDGVVFAPFVVVSQQDGRVLAGPGCLQEFRGQLLDRSVFQHVHVGFGGDASVDVLKHG